TAHARAEQARREFAAAKSDSASAWSLRFRLLEADILLKQGRLAEVITLLTPDGVSIPLQGDSAIKGKLLCGLARSRLGQTEESKQELRAARELAESAHSPLIAEVLRTEGLFARDAGQLEVATGKFKSSIAALRSDSDPMLKAANLVDLGYTNLLSGH